MRLTPPEPVITDEGFTDENDIFKYRPFAERLTNLIRNIDEPLVIALDGPWGSGKSVFVKQWAGLLRQHGAQVIQFDAFGNDHFEDAFLALSGEIYATAKSTFSGNKYTVRQFLNKAKKVGFALTPIGLRIAAKGGTVGFASLEDFQAVGETAKAAANALADESAKLVKDAVSNRLRKVDDERAALTAFRDALSVLAQEFESDEPEGGKPFPLIFIIDELDRCRPPFALSIIERVKHLFSVQGVCFVFVTNLTQLGQTVQGAYGYNFDARTYLEKFYNLRVVLPDNTLVERRRKEYISYLWSTLGISFPEQHHESWARDWLEELSEHHALSLRQLERVMTNVVLASASVGPRQAFFPPLVIGLCIMRQINPGLYEKARSRTLTWSDARDFLWPAYEGEDREDNNHAFWKYATGEPMGDKENIFSNLLHRYNMHAKENFLPFMADYIDELAIHEERN